MVRAARDADDMVADGRAVPDPAQLDDATDLLSVNDIINGTVRPRRLGPHSHRPCLTPRCRAATRTA
jgi:hypothetical protein